MTATMRRPTSFKRSIILFRIASRWICPLTVIVFIVASVMVIDLESHFVRHGYYQTDVLLRGWETLDFLAIGTTLVTGIAAFPRWQSLVSLGLLVIMLPIFFFMYIMASIIC